jgi:outer membrane lipoprotein SlyB
MNKLGELARDPQTATLVGAATGAVKGVLIGAAIGKLAICVTLGVIGGAISGSVISYLARGQAAEAQPAAIPVRINR